MGRANKKQYNYFFLEADRSSMPVIRSRFDQSSILKKLLAYWASYQQGIITNVLGLKPIRILTITKSQERINNMIAAGKEADPWAKGSRIFLFSQAKQFTLKNPIRILEPVWQNGRDQQLVSLID